VTIEDKLRAAGITPTKEAVAAYHVAQSIADKIIADLEAGESKLDSDKPK